MYWNIVKTKNSALSLNLFLTLAHTSQFFQILLRQVLQIYHKLYDGKNNREDTFTNLKATQLCVPSSQSALGPSGNSSQDLSFREEVCAQSSSIISNKQGSKIYVDVFILITTLVLEQFKEIVILENKIIQSRHTKEQSAMETIAAVCPVSDVSPASQIGYSHKPPLV